MFVVVKKSKTTTRELVYIVESYRDDKQRIRQRIVKKCGELSELLAEDPEALDKLKEQARLMTDRSASRKSDLTVSFSLPNSESSPMMNYGYFFTDAIFNSLKIEQFLERRMRDSAKANKTAAALRYFASREFFSPLPQSALPKFEETIFHDTEADPKPSLADISLSDGLAQDLQRHIYRVANKGHEPDDSVASLDIASYHFNAASRGMASVGASLDSMILVQVGYLFDRYRNPMSCAVFPEGSDDTDALLAKIATLRKAYSLSRIVVTSDRAFGSNAALAALHDSGNGYVVGRKLSSASKEMQEMVLDEKGYRWNKAGTFKFKTMSTQRHVGRTVIPEKIVFMWTASNAAKAKQFHDASIIGYLASPEATGAGLGSDMDKYVRIHDTPLAPGETLSEQSFFSFDAQSYARDVALEGYYALVSTELDIPDSVIIRRYHNLQRMGRAYGPPDPDAEITPGDEWNLDEVRAYFLVSFVSMVIGRKLERMVGYKHGISELRQALDSAMCKNIGQGIFNLTRRSPVVDDVEAAFGVSFDKAFATLEMLRKYRRDINNGV